MNSPSPEVVKVQKTPGSAGGWSELSLTVTAHFNNQLHGTL